MGVPENNCSFALLKGDEKNECFMVGLHGFGDGPGTLRLIFEKLHGQGGLVFVYLKYVRTYDPSLDNLGLLSRNPITKGLSAYYMLPEDDRKALLADLDADSSKNRRGSGRTVSRSD